MQQDVRTTTWALEFYDVPNTVQYGNPNFSAGYTLEPVGRNLNYPFESYVPPQLRTGNARNFDEYFENSALFWEDWCKNFRWGYTSVHCDRANKVITFFFDNDFMQMTFGADVANQGFNALMFSNAGPQVSLEAKFEPNQTFCTFEYANSEPAGHPVSFDGVGRKRKGY